MAGERVENTRPCRRRSRAYSQSYPQLIFCATACRIAQAEAAPADSDHVGVTTVCHTQMRCQKCETEYGI